MKIPSMLYGRPGAVKSRCRKLAKDLVATRKFDAFDPGPFLETSEVPGLLLVEPDRVMTDDDHFQCWALSAAFGEATPHQEYFAIAEEWVKWSLAEPWRFLGIAGQENVTTLDRKPSLLVPFVKAAVDFWPILTAEGKRYGPVAPEPRDAWDAVGNLHFALARLGIPAKDLGRPPSGGPAEFLKRINESGTHP